METSSRVWFFLTYFHRQWPHLEHVTCLSGSLMRSELSWDPALPKKEKVALPPGETWLEHHVLHWIQGILIPLAKSLRKDLDYFFTVPLSLAFTHGCK